MNSFASFQQMVQLHQPKLAVVLGSGQGHVPHGLQELASIAFTDVPGLVATSVVGHSGRIVLGKLVNQPVLIYRGRLHFYEGHSWERIGTPLRIAHELGIQMVLLTNAAGGIHDSLNPGSLMALNDHLFLQSPSAWRGPGPWGSALVLGNRTSPYSPRLVRCLQEVSFEQGMPLLAGVYAAVTGPGYETPAEIRAFRAMGADAVGMSTAYEVETAQALGMECAAISLITNKAAGLAGKPLDHQEVLEMAAQGTDRISQLITGFVKHIG